ESKEIRLSFKEETIATESGLRIGALQIDVDDTSRREGILASSGAVSVSIKIVEFVVPSESTSPPSKTVSSEKPSTGVGNCSSSTISFSCTIFQNP
ncbi:unnamed protein product, partial [Didymodactylos carnosus]